jgi:hypothetical protein
MFKPFQNKSFRIFTLICVALIVAGIGMHLSMTRSVIHYDASAPHIKDTTVVATPAVPVPVPVPVLPLDKVAYDAKLLAIANLPVVAAPKTSTKTTTKTPPKPTTPPPSLWPVKTVYPLGGALLPFNRIVAYYGNFYSTAMGVLGEYPPDVMLQKLRAAAAEWKTADPTTPVIPAIDYIAVTAQGSPGKDGKYRARMPGSEIQKAIALADQVNGIVILDVQVGKSDVKTEIPLLEAYLKLPKVELALDPEFSMKTDKRPGTIIGTMDATDINYAANYLASLVKQYNLPPKILIVHRFTEDMVTNYKNITPLPEVEVVMDMDGWGIPAKKINIYNQVVSRKPVQFAGIKLFYKNDLALPTHAMLTLPQVLKLSPQPSFIQYQ